MLCGKNWNSLLESTKKTQNNMFCCLKSIISEESADSIVKFIYGQFKEPMLPPLKLKRESIICITRTLYQDKLSQVLYEDADKDLDESCIDPLVQAAVTELKEKETKLVSQIVSKSDREDLLRARWYTHNNDDTTQRSEQRRKRGPGVYTDSEDLIWEMLDSDFSPAECQLQSKEPPPLLKLYSVLFAAIKNQCQLTFEYLSNLSNVYDLIAEYAIRWNTYVAAMLQFEENLKVMTDIINKAYETCFPGFPSFPKFSFWRLMVKTWLREVYGKCHLGDALIQSFLRIMNNHRERILKFAADSNFSNIEDQIDTEFGLEMPKELFVSLNTKKFYLLLGILYKLILFLNRQRSVLQKGIIMKKIENAPHPCFGTIQTEQSLLATFLQTIIDLSMNEVSIHYIDCTALPCNYPYYDLEQRFLEYSEEFCEEHMKIFYDSPNYYYRFLQSDLSFLTEVLSGRTSARLEKIMIEKSCQLLQEVVFSALQSTTPEAFESLEIPPKLKCSPIHEDLQSFLENVCTSAKEKTEFKESFIHHIKAEASQCYYRKLIALIESSAHTDFRANFDYLNKRNLSLQDISVRDRHILMHNKSKNVPEEIGDVDSLFYDLDKDVDIVLVEQLAEKFRQANQTQEVHTEVSMVVEEEEKTGKHSDNATEERHGRTSTWNTWNTDDHAESINQLLKGINDAGAGEIIFDDLDIDDLPSLDTLTLKK